MLVSRRYCTHTDYITLFYFVFFSCFLDIPIENILLVISTEIYLYIQRDQCDVSIDNIHFSRRMCVLTGIVWKSILILRLYKRICSQFIDLDRLHGTCMIGRKRHVSVSRRDKIVWPDSLKIRHSSIIRASGDPKYTPKHYKPRKSCKYNLLSSKCVIVSLLYVIYYIVNTLYVYNAVNTAGRRFRLWFHPDLDPHRGGWN